MVLILSACGLFSSDDGRNRPTELTDYPPAVHLSTAWSAVIGSGSGIGFAPVVVNDAVYAATPNGRLGKYDLQTGLPRWRADANIRLSAGVGSDGATTVVAALDGEIIAYDDVGHEKWRTRATSNVGIPPIVGYNMVVVRSGDYRIQAFDVNSGERLWHVQRPGPALALQAPSQLVMVEGLIITGLPGGKLLALDAATGNVQWEGTVASPRGASDLERLTDVVGVPRMAGPLLCAVAYQGRITCFDVGQGGRALWSKDFSSTSGMDLNKQFAFATDQHSLVSAFALHDGASVWQQSALRNRALTAPVVLAAAVAVGDYEGYIHLLSVNDGKLLGRVSVGGGTIVSPLISTARGVLVQTGNGNLVMLNAQY
jgi:outer membrane protein assembly factor BamB